MHVQGKGGSKITNLENIPYGWFLGDIKYIKDALLWEKEINQWERAHKSGFFYKNSFL